MDAAHKTGPALEKTYRFLLWLVPTVEKFPRSQKFLLGDRIQATALDVLEGLIEATYSRERAGHLARVNLLLQKLPGHAGMHPDRAGSSHGAGAMATSQHHRMEEGKTDR